VTEKKERTKSRRKGERWR